MSCYQKMIGDIKNIDIKEIVLFFYYEKYIAYTYIFDKVIFIYFYVNT